MKKVLFFLNIGSSSANPWLSIDAANSMRDKFILQNKITWIKSISIKDNSYGHFKPINSNRYINSLHEDIFHFTKSGNVEIDRLSIGVPFVHTSNTTRWNHNRTKRCRGNAWFLPYTTITNNKKQRGHPAVFPVDLPTYCIKLHGIKNTKLVLDPFGGTGSTAVACVHLGINCISIDLDKEYTKISKERINEQNLL